VNRGYNYKRENGKGYRQNLSSTNEAKLVSFLPGPFYSGYNIIALDTNYKYALVAGKSLDYLWCSQRKTRSVNIKLFCKKQPRLRIPGGESGMGEAE